jgi:hypothetical protein
LMNGEAGAVVCPAASDRDFLERRAILALQYACGALLNPACFLKPSCRPRTALQKGFICDWQLRSHAG